MCPGAGGYDGAVLIVPEAILLNQVQEIISKFIEETNTEITKIDCFELKENSIGIKEGGLKENIISLICNNLVQI